MQPFFIGLFDVNHACPHTKQNAIALNVCHSRRRAQNVPAPPNSELHLLIRCPSKRRRRTEDCHTTRAKGDVKTSPMASPVANMWLVGCFAVRPIGMAATTRLVDVCPSRLNLNTWFDTSAVTHQQLSRQPTWKHQRGCSSVHDTVPVPDHELCLFTFG